MNSRNGTLLRIHLMEGLVLGPRPPTVNPLDFGLYLWDAICNTKKKSGLKNVIFQNGFSFSDLSPRFSLPGVSGFPHPKPCDLRLPCWISPRSLFPTGQRFPTPKPRDFRFPEPMIPFPTESAAYPPQNHVTSVRHVCMTSIPDDVPSG